MKPAIVEQIEQLWGKSFELHPAPAYPNDPLEGLMAYKEGRPKYMAAGGRLTGLNLSATNLDDARWGQIVELLEKASVRLQALNLSHNRLTKFAPPPNIIALQKLDVDKNPLAHPPKQVVEQGNAAILNFFRQAEEQEGTVPLYEAKLLIVGQPGAGKTTLLRKLINPAYLAPPQGDPDLESTVGINIHEGWEFPFPEEPEVTFKANLWDFGGQVIQYMTHHFFLTPRALYVLVADDRKQNTEFDYWFRIINLLGRESEQEKVSLLVVLNEINHVSVTNFDHTKYRKDYPGMHIQVWDIDFSREDARSKGLPEIVKDMLCELPQIRDPLPRLWAPIREELIERRKQEPHITFADFAEICSRGRGGKSLAREEDQRYLSAYLHRLGVMLHYQDELHLDNFVILDPQWAVDAVYSVLKDSRVEKNQGRFTEEDLRELLKGYSADERSRLLSLMLKDKFEICYPSSRPGEYIAPHLLPGLRPAYSWDSARAMKFRYQYPFMPKGLISRLIVRLSEDIAEGGKLVWKEGVVIERGGCRAQAVQGKTAKEGLEILEVELCGPERERKFLLRHVMTEVEKIHEKSFKHIAYEKMIPCNCAYCKGSESPAFFEYSELLQYEQEGWDMIDCRNVKLKKVSVKGLLEGVFEKDYSGVKAKVKALVEKGEIEQALQELGASFPDDDEVVLLKSRWATLQNEASGGRVPYADKEARQNQIKHGILQYLDNVGHFNDPAWQ